MLFGTSTHICSKLRIDIFRLNNFELLFLKKFSDFVYNFSDRITITLRVSFDFRVIKVAINDMDIPVTVSALTAFKALGGNASLSSIS